METLASEDFGAKRYKEVWRRVKNEIRSERTLSQYLKHLENDGLIARQQVSHKKVLYQILKRHRDEWAFVAEPDPFENFSLRRHQKMALSFLLESLGDKRKAMALALRYAFTSFFHDRIQNIARRLVLAEHKNRPLVIEREAYRYKLFLKFIASFLQENQVDRAWIEAATNVGPRPPLTPPQKTNTSTSYPFQESLTSELELLGRVVEETDPELAKTLDISKAAMQIGLKLHKQFMKEASLLQVEPSEDISEVIALRDRIETEILPLVDTKKKISLKELRMLYKETTGEILSAAALAQVLRAVPKGSPLWKTVKPSLTRKAPRPCKSTV